MIRTSYNLDGVLTLHDPIISLHKLCTLLQPCIKSCYLIFRMSATIKLGAKVRRRNDNGMDLPGSVVRVKDDGVLVYWPTDYFYQLLPVAELEPYETIPELVAA
jgi:hypothetical protein